jgi:hypothetical protein
VDDRAVELEGTGDVGLAAENLDESFCAVDKESLVRQIHFDKLPLVVQPPRGPEAFPLEVARAPSVRRPQVEVSPAE